MTNTIDGFIFDVPAAESQIVELAQYHRKQLDEAIIIKKSILGIIV